VVWCEQRANDLLGPRFEFSRVDILNDSLSEGAPQRHLLHDLQKGRIRLNRAFF
jgi:hypothetical protein